MQRIEISPGIYWVGAVDWDVRTFHGAHHATEMGTTYNAYLIDDDKVTLVDTVHRKFTQEMVERISDILDPSEIDYIVANHGEPDHSGSIPEALEFAPNATVLCSKMGERSLEGQFGGDLRLRTVGNGEEVSIGDRTLHFIEARMLHWPDSMFTYLPEERILLSNDAFGQHLASNKRFDDQVDYCDLMKEARTYYANILNPYSNLVERKISEIQESGLEIGMIAPAHGIIWRKDPGKIIQAYLDWATGKAGEGRVIVAYETMWGGTESMARRIVEGLSDAGLEVKMQRLSATHRSEVISELLEAEGVIIGSSTLNKGVLPQVAELLSEIKGLEFGDRIGGAFGCYGWGGGATKVIAQTFEETGIEMPMDPLRVNWYPDEDGLGRCYRYGKDFADKLRS